MVRYSTESRQSVFLKRIHVYYTYIYILNIIHFNAFLIDASKLPQIVNSSSISNKHSNQCCKSKFICQLILGRQNTLIRKIVSLACSLVLVHQITVSLHIFFLCRLYIRLIIYPYKIVFSKKNRLASKIFLLVYVIKILRHLHMFFGQTIFL